MKAKIFHEMTTEELNNKLAELKKQLFELRFEHATGQQANPMSMVTCKKDIARVKTVLRQRELNPSLEPAGKKAKK